MKMKRPLIKALAVVLAFLLGAPQGVIAQSGAEEKTFSQEELDQLVAPIALYPDSLLAQILMASTYPLEVVQAERWVKANQKLKGDALTTALEKENWDPSVKSLVNFPQVLDMMNEKLDWTQKLGDAFLAQQKDVMATVQKLRPEGQGAGQPEDQRAAEGGCRERDADDHHRTRQPAGRLCADLQPYGGLRNLVVSVLSPCLLLPAHLRTRRRLVFLWRGGGHGRRLGLCVGRLRLGAR